MAGHNKGAGSMDKKTIGAWIMYHEVQRLQLEGLSHSAIAIVLAMNRRTVVKYASMSEAGYEAFLSKKDNRSKLLSMYETFVRDRLTAHPAASAAQVHDWLKEYHKDFPSTSIKTVYNFVMAIRQKYGIAVSETTRDYFVVGELPYGLQAQADFGQYVLRNIEERRKKIHFFVMMLFQIKNGSTSASLNFPLHQELLLMRMKKRSGFLQAYQKKLFMIRTDFSW